MWHIVSDSSCDLFQLPEQDADIRFSTVPFSIHISGEEYRDDDRISVDQMLTANENSSAMAHTACPSPQDWLDQFSGDGPILAFTISSALSGSYNSANTAKEMLLEEEPEREIAVIDTRATGPETVLLIRKAAELIHQGKTLADIEAALKAEAERTHIVFALSSYRNLIKSGRVSRLIGFIAGHLGFWGIGVGSDEGEIVIRGKARGEKSMVRFLVDEIARIGLAGKEILISHCMNSESAQLLKKALEERFEGIRVAIMATRGLDSFYAERHGLIIGF